MCIQLLLALLCICRGFLLIRHAFNNSLSTLLYSMHVKEWEDTRIPHSFYIYIRIYYISHFNCSRFFTLSLSVVPFFFLFGYMCVCFLTVSQSVRRRVRGESVLMIICPSCKLPLVCPSFIRDNHLLLLEQQQQQQQLAS